MTASVTSRRSIRWRASIQKAGRSGSGESRVDQGISKQGSRRVRALLIEMAWFWLRYQPDSALAKWFVQRTQGSGTNKRGKRITIVAVARRLAIALWRYLKDGEIPEGAALKAA